VITAINPDTLNELGVCSAKNLIRFKKDHFHAVEKGGDPSEKSGGKREVKGDSSLRSE
jgi:hypothetical protein